MADFVFNIAKGRVAELYNRVDSSDPTNAVLVIVAIDRGAATDATMKDYDTLAALLGDADVDEVTNTNYARIELDDTDLSAMSVDDTNDRMPLDIGDQTWTAIAAGDAWTDLVICYDPDSTGGTDSAIIPLTNHTFAITPDGSDIVATISDFYRAS